MMIDTPEFKSQLKAACDNLWWSSESDYPVESVWYSPDEALGVDQTPLNAVLDEATVRQLTHCDKNVRIEIVEIEDFFARATTPKSWHTDTDKAQRIRLEQLKTLLVNALSNVQVYRCGDIEIQAYVLGNTADGGIAGVKTTLIET